MPTYLYKCEIHKEFEVQQKITDPHLEECPKCKKNGKKSAPPKRLISATSFQLKGGGWASEGYKK
jgi:putative FmdB family regulatory protein